MWRRLSNVWRRYTGSYFLEDPRPVARQSPYTYFLPLDGELASLKPGDLVKLIFKGLPPRGEWDAERMWVKVKRVDKTWCHGVLDNDPSDLPQLRFGQKVRFRREFVVGVQHANPADVPEDTRREYWERCLVDTCVLDGQAKVGYLYREEPDMGEAQDKYPDSGWRIRGESHECAGTGDDEPTPAYVALGAVLNQDDSWLHLIDSPVGSAFSRDFVTGTYHPEESAGS